jgi:hypothetical protein
LQATGRSRERGHSTQQFEGVLIASAGIGVQISGELALMAPGKGCEAKDVTQRT